VAAETAAEVAPVAARAVAKVVPVAVRAAKVARVTAEAVAIKLLDKQFK